MTNDEGVPRDPEFRHSSFVLRHSRPWILRAVWAAGLLVLGGVVGSQFFGRPGYHKQGSLVWIDNESYVIATRTLQALEDKVRAELTRSLAKEKKAVEAPRMPTSGGIVAAPPAADAREKLAVGQKLAAGDQPRAVLLDDGTPVYLNRDSAVTYECRGELTLDRGEIYVERRFVPSRNVASKGAAEKPPVGFVVNLPKGEVVTWTSKVDLRIKGDGVRIVVVRGKVLVGETPILAGQSFVYRGDKQIAGTMRKVVERPLAAIAWTYGANHVAPPHAAGPSQPDEKADSFFVSPMPRDWIFLVECSGDRTPQAARTQIEIVRNLLELAEDGDTATLIVAGARPRILAPYRLDATPETTLRVVEMLEQAHLVGGLNLQRAIEAAQPFFVASRNPVLVHVGAGHASLGQYDPQALLAKIPGSVRYLGIAATAEKWPEFIAAAARQPGSRAVKIGPEDDIRASVIELLDAMDQPALPDHLVAGWHVPAATGVGTARPRPSPTMQAWCPQGLATQLLALAWENLLPRIGPIRFVMSDLKVSQELLLAGWQWHSGRLAEADRRFQRLLTDPQAARCPLLWRLAARLADERGQFGRAIACWEKALELARAKPAAIQSIDAMRRDYGWLLDECHKLALATAGLHTTPPRDLVARVMDAADRWRLLDPDPTPACYAAARVLADLGATDEAREYVTTPPEWKKLAERLEKEGYGGMTREE